MARPMAQGQAMMRTATKFRSARVNAGSGPKRSQTTNVMSREHDNDGHEDAADPIRQPLQGRLGALSLLDHLR